MTTGTVEPITEVQEKTMAVLAEILRAEGVLVANHKELEIGSHSPAVVTFRCDTEFQAFAVADIALREGYLLFNLVGAWNYCKGRRLRPYWTLVFPAKEFMQK